MNIFKGYGCTILWTLLGYGLAYFNEGKTKQNQQRLFFTIFVASFEYCLSHVDHKLTIIAELNKNWFSRYSTLHIL